MTRNNRIVFRNGIDELECQIGEPKLKTIHGIEMLVLPKGDCIALSNIINFNGISFFQ